MVIQDLLTIFLYSEGVSTDTRSIKPGQLYFALKDPTFDGNQYAAGALASGASHAIIDNAAHKKGEQYILVDDVLTTLQELARAYRETWQCPVIGLTGSNGKTTTKELLARALQAKFKVSYTSGNLNNHIGVPLTLLRADPKTEVVIIEMGANHVGEIAELCAIARPTHGLITNIGRAHLEGFGGIEGVRRGKAELYTWLASSGGIAIYDVADEELRNLIELTNPKNTVLYSSEEECQVANAIVWSKKLEQEFPVVQAEVVVEGNPYKLDLAIPGRYNFKNALAALSVAEYLGVDPEEALEALANYLPTNKRSEIIYWKGVLVLLDAYNANLDSMHEALRWLAGRPESPKLAVLGELREMGVYSVNVHQQLIQQVNDLKNTEVLYFGEAYTDQVAQSQRATTIEELRSQVNAWVETNNTGVVLIKGSRGNRLERLVENE